MHYSKLNLFQLAVVAVATAFLSSCTGSLTALPEAAGGMVIRPGEKLTIDMTEIVSTLKLKDYDVSLRTVTPDYSSTSILMNLTTEIKASMGQSTIYDLTLPKGLQATKPLMVMVQIPSIGKTFVDLAFDRERSLHPGIASTLAYRLIRNYKPRVATDFTDSDFGGIRGEIQSRISKQIRESEQFSPSNLPFPKVWRYHLNGVAFNPEFYAKVKNFKIDYTVVKGTPTGLLASDTPEGSLDPYQFAVSFSYPDGKPVDVLPFGGDGNDNFNTLPSLNWTNTGTGVVGINEGNGFTLRASFTDPNGDFIDKNRVIEYSPRVLPKSRTDHFDWAYPEKAYSLKTDTYLGPPTAIEDYAGEIIGSNEALDLSAAEFNPASNPPVDLDFYKKPGPDGRILNPNASGVDTAHERIYYLVSDGMIPLPFSWNYTFYDNNQAPVIITDQNGNPNSSSLDSLIDPTGTIQTKNTSVNGVDTGIAVPWQKLGSHCQILSDQNGNELWEGVNPFQRVRNSSDNRWSCSFLTYDPDSDIDPNGSADQLYYSVAVPASVDTYLFRYSGTNPNPLSSTSLETDWTSIHAWPIFDPESTATESDRVQGTLLQTCFDSSGLPHRRCGLGLVQVEVDINLQKAGAGRDSFHFPYSVSVYDRATAGKKASFNADRIMNFDPVPPRLINFSKFEPSDYPISSLPDREVDRAQVSPVVYKYGDLYLAQLIRKIYGYSTNTLPNGVPLSETFYSKLPELGFGNPSSSLLPSTREAANKILLGSAERGFFQLTHSDSRYTVSDNTERMSDYFTRPKQIKFTPSALTVTVPAGGSPQINLATFTPGSLTFLGNNLSTAMASKYAHPMEYDKACGQNASTSLGWDQTSEDVKALGGFTFELNSINMLNVDLKVNSSFMPVFFKFNGTDMDLLPKVNLSEISYCAYNTWNTSPYLGFTYDAVKNTAGAVLAPAKDAETCTWKPLPASGIITEMQPIPVYFKKETKPGIFEVRKYVYHRARFRWTPRDGYDHTQAAGSPERAKEEEFIQNRILAGFQLMGDRFYDKIRNTGTIDTTLYPEAYLDQVTYTTDFPLLAERREMKPCFRKANAYGASSDNPNIFSYPDPVPKTSPYPVVGWAFAMDDENYPRLSVNALPIPSPTPTYGKFRAEVVSSAGTIDSDIFARKALFIQNLSMTDAGTSFLSTPGVATWYGLDDGLPRLRLESVLNPAPFPEIGSGPSNSNAPFRIEFTKRALSTGRADGSVWDEVLLLTRNSSNASEVINLGSNAELTQNSGQTCLPYTSLKIEEKIKTLLIPSNCGNLKGHVRGQNLAPAGATYTLRVQFVLNPAINENGGYDSLLPKDLTLDYLPFFYGLGSPGSEQNTFAFQVSPLNTLKLTKRASGASLPNYFNPDNLLALPSPNPNDVTSAELLPIRNDSRRFSLSTTHVDPDSAANPVLLTNLTDPIYSCSSTTAGGNYCVNFQSGIYKLYAKIPTTGTLSPLVLSFNGVDSPAALMENDPFDVVRYETDSANPAPSPDELKLNRPDTTTDCKTIPTGYPAVSSLYLANLVPFKKCNLTWKPDPLKAGLTETTSTQAPIHKINVRDFGTEGAAYTGGWVVTGPKVTDVRVKDTTDYRSFSVQLFTAENNLTPEFYLGSGSTAGINSSYYSAASDANSPWAKIGIPPGLTSIGSGDTLLSNGVDGSGNPVAFDFPEGGNITQAPITINARDANKTTSYSNLFIDLKNFTPGSTSKSRKVYSIDMGTLYDMNAWSTWSVLSSTPCSSGPDTSGVPKNCFVTISMTNPNWFLSDTDAYKLSGTKGFLVPIEVTDQAGDSSTPLKFRDTAKSRTIWLYAKSKVKNNTPVVRFFDSTVAPTSSPTENSFGAGQAFSFPTGKLTQYTIRIRDTDFEGRFSGGFNQPISANLSTPGASGSLGLSFTTSGSVTCDSTTKQCYQDYILKMTPGSTTGLFSDPKITITDPGDPAKSANRCVNGCSTLTGTNYLDQVSAFDLPFRIRIDGKPRFLTQTGSYEVFTGNNFTLPISVQGSKSEDIVGNIFVGTQIPLATVSPGSLKPASSSATAGVNPWVSSGNLLTWYTSGLTSTSSLSVNLYAINSKYCYKTKPSGSNVALLVRFNAGVSDICYYYSTPSVPPPAVAVDYAANGANPITLTLNYNNKTPPSFFSSAPSISNPKLTRNHSFQSPPSVTSLNRQECQEFQAHSLLRGTLPWNCSTGDSNYSFTASTGLQYQFTSTGSSPALIRKVITDTIMTDTSAIVASAYKNETVTLNATVTPPLIPSSVTNSPYISRWYVNGCLKSQGQYTGTQDLTFDAVLSWMSAGRNDLCPGTYTQSSLATSDQGLITATLVVSWGDENLSSGTLPSSVRSYSWKINVLNQDPVIISTSEIAISATDSKIPAPINLGTVPLSVIVTDSSSNNYLARAEGSKIIVTAMNKDGTLASVPLFVVTCSGSGFNYLAVEPPSGTKGWSVAASTLSLATLSGVNATTSTLCTKKFAVADIPASAAPIPSPTPFAFSQSNTVSNTDLGMLFLLKYSVGMNSSTLGVNTTSASTLVFSGTTNALSGNTYTSTGMTSLFASSVPSVYQYPGGGGTGYSIKRTSLKDDGSTLAQSVKLTGTGGIVVNRLIVSSLTSTGKITPANAGFRTFTVAGTSTIAGLGTGSDVLCGPNPGYSGEFYDQLYLGGPQIDKMILIFKDDTNKIGRVYLLNSVMGNGAASCAEIGTVNYPDISRTVTSQNRLIYDSARDLVYGAIGSATGDQLFTYDLIRGTFILSPVPGAAGKISEILNPGSTNSTSLFIIPPASGTTPLYKVW